MEEKKKTGLIQTVILICNYEGQKSIKNKNKLTLQKKMINQTMNNYLIQQLVPFLIDMRVKVFKIN